MDEQEEKIAADPKGDSLIFGHMKRYFIAGILILLPLALTFWFMWNIFSFIEGILANFLKGTPYYIPGEGVAVVLLFIYVTGLVATNYIGKKLISLGEAILNRIPFVRKVYQLFQQVVQAIWGDKKEAFQKVVLIQYPRKGIYSIGLITAVSSGEPQYKTKEKVFNVFLPTVPNPTSGLLLLVPQEEIIELDMSIEDAFKLIISGGVIVPPYSPPSLESGLKEASKIEKA